MLGAKANLGVLDDESAKELGLNGLIRFFLRLKSKKITKQENSKSAYYKFILMTPNGNQLNDIKSLVEAEKVKPIIDETFPFSQTIDALVYQKSGRVKGKIVVKMK